MQLHARLTLLPVAGPKRAEDYPATTPGFGQMPEVTGLGAECMGVVKGAEVSPVTAML